MEFAGFTPKQKYALLKGMDYTGSAQSDEMDAFLASSPSAASMMGEYSKIAQQRIEGRPLSGIGMAAGGFVANEFYDVENNVLSQGNNLGSFETETGSSSLIKMLGPDGVPYYQTIGGWAGNEVTNTFKDIESAMAYVAPELPQPIVGGNNLNTLQSKMDSARQELGTYTIESANSSNRARARVGELTDTIADLERQLASTPQPIVGGDNPENLEAANVSGGYNPGISPEEFSKKVLSAAVELPGYEEYAVDFNEDGRVGADDALYALKNNTTSLPGKVEGAGTTAVPAPGMVGLNTSTNVASGTTTTEVPATIGTTDNLNDTGASETMVEQTTNGYTGVDDFTTESGGTALNTLQSQLADARQKLAALTPVEKTGETGQALLKTITDRENKITIAQQNIGDSAPSGAELVATGMNKPSALVTKPEVEKITENANQLIGVGTGKVTDAAAAGTTTVSDVSQVGAVTAPGASTYTADKSSDDVTAETSKLSAAQLDGLTKSISAQSYTVDQLNFLGFDAAQIAQYQKVGTVTDIPDLTEEQKIKAAVLADIEIPEAVAQTLTFDPVAFKADAAKFVGDTPEATAAKDYNLGPLSGAKSTVDVVNEIIKGAGGDLEAAQAKAKESLRLIEVGYAEGKVTLDQVAEAQTRYDEVITSIASGSVTEEMIVNFAGVGLSPEQAGNITSEYESGLEAVKGKVAIGETPGPQDTYNLDPAAIAEIVKTAIIDPATNTDFPEGTAATTEYESIIEGASNEIAADELINAALIGVNQELVAQTVFATAKTMEQVNEAAFMKAATATFSQSALADEYIPGVPQAMSTVKGQLSTLMNEFKDGTPAWAAGAVRAANALMASRGLGGSSMAGAAIIQAALESALPIAEQDARFYQEMDMTNLSNKQAVSLANAAAVQGIELRNLDNEQATALKNSTQAFELQSMNLSNLQGTVLANLNVKASLQNKSLDVNTQSAVANAARYAELNNINLSNEQQSLLQESSENLQLELSELSNSQQMSLSMLQTKAALMGQNLSNEQQTAMLESTQLFEAANFNASAQQQAFMQDAQAQAALEGRALDTRQQTALFNAARIATVNDMNLTNEQQVLLAKSTENLQVEVQNLSNRQQTELANTQLRAALQGKVLDNEQQAAVLNAAQYAETQNINLSHEQQAFVQDAVSKAAMEGKVLDNKQQAMLFNTARAAQVADINLNNEQQSLILETNQAFDQDMTNLSNRQQTELANAQLRAALQGKVLDNEQQAAILGATRYAEANNITVTNKQQALIQEYASRTVMEGKVLDNEQQARIFNISNEVQERGLELTNQQQVNLFNTANNLEVEMANLSNKQQTELANAQIEASLRGQELSNKQQAKVLNASRISEIANINFNAEQQREIENARLSSTVDLANLDSKSAKMLSEMASLAAMDTAAMNNRQQAEVQNAQNFLQMDLSNLNNEQQTSVFKSQQNIAALFNDQAAENAKLQFNAASENQVNQFFADLQVNVGKFNVDQANAIKQFNAGETNAVDKFNAQLKSVRNQFNSSNALLIEQANTKWKQDIATMDTAAQNEANHVAAKMAAEITSSVMDQVWQRERDLMSFAFTATESMADRALEIVMGDKLEAMEALKLESTDSNARDYLITKMLLGDWSK